MIEEARVEQSEAGLVAVTDGWFVVNVRDAEWMTHETFGAACPFERADASFPDLGINVRVLQPGQPNALYHAESNQEDIIVLAGECLLLVEGEERPLRAWDFVHFPPNTEHIVVGAGDGPAVVLVHAGIADASQWDAQLEALRDRFRVVRYDVAGFGRSALRPGPFSHVADLHALLEHLGVERATLVGNSNGARIALEYALAHPNAVGALVLVAGGLSDHDWSSEMQRADAEETERFDAGDFAGAAESQVRFWLDGRRRAGRVEPALRERVTRMVLRSYELYASAAGDDEEPRVEWLDPPSARRLDEIGVTTLVVVGEHDVPDMFEIADRLEAGIPDARTAIVAGAAHLVPMERPDEFNRLLLEFLDAR